MPTNVTASSEDYILSFIASEQYISYTKSLGSKGDDEIYIFNDGDNIFTRAGDDYVTVDIDVFSESGGSLLNGGTGRDTIEYLVLLEINPGVVINLDKEWAFRTYASGGKDKKDTVVGFENVYGSEGADSLVGNAVGNLLLGGDDNDILKGLAGDDTLIGAHDNNTYPYFYQYYANDTLIGGIGNDILVGDLGGDRLEGGKGADTFAFEATYAHHDTLSVIVDFRAGQGDMIDVSGIDAREKSKGDQDFKFLGSKLFSRTAGELNFRGGVLSGDVDGDGQADFQIRLAGTKALSAADIIL